MRDSIEPLLEELRRVESDGFVGLEPWADSQMRGSDFKPDTETNRISNMFRAVYRRLEQELGY